MSVEPPITARAALLHVLISGDGYGLDLIGRVREATGGRVELHQGSVYPALAQLEREGLLESYDGETTHARGGRPRRYYRLTAEGRKAAREVRKAVVSLFKLVPA